MIKIEKLNGAKAVFSRDGVEQPAFVNVLLTRGEYETLKVLEGTVVVSIDEQEVITISAQDGTPTPQGEQSKSVEQGEPAVEAPVTIAAPPTPAPKTIVRPKPRAVAR